MTKKRQEIVLSVPMSKILKQTHKARIQGIEYPDERKLKAKAFKEESEMIIQELLEKLIANKILKQLENGNIRAKKKYQGQKLPEFMITVNHLTKALSAMPDK